MKAKLPHGSFLPWIKSEFGMKEQSARNFMNVATRFGKSPIIGDFNPTVLYELASPSTPDSVIEKAIASSENGEKVSVKEVQEWKKRAIANSELFGICPKALLRGNIPHRAAFTSLFFFLWIAIKHFFQ